MKQRHQLAGQSRECERKNSKKPRQQASKERGTARRRGSRDAVPTGTAIRGPPVDATAYAPPKATRSAHERRPRRSGSLSRRALTSSRTLQPRARPLFSGRFSSRPMEPFAPPSAEAVRCVPASWKASLSSVGACRPPSPSPRYPQCSAVLTPLFVSL